MGPPDPTELDGLAWILRMVLSAPDLGNGTLALADRQKHVVGGATG